MEASITGKGYFNQILDKPAITLGAIGGIAAGSAFALNKLFFEPQIEKGEKDGLSRKKYADTTQTIGLSFLAAAVVIAGMQQLKARI